MTATPTPPTPAASGDLRRLEHEIEAGLQAGRNASGGVGVLATKAVVGVDPAITAAIEGFAAYREQVGKLEAENEKLKAFVEWVVGKSKRGTYWGDAAYDTIAYLDDNAQKLLASLSASAAAGEDGE